MPFDINKREFSAMPGEEINPKKIKKANEIIKEIDSIKETEKLEKFLNINNFINTYNLHGIKEEFDSILEAETSEKIMNELMQQAEDWHNKGNSDKDIEEQLKHEAEKNLNFGKKAVQIF